MTKLDKLTIPRSFGLKDVDEEVVLHVFVDASVIGYGAVAYFVRGDKVVVWVVRYRGWSCNLLWLVLR